MFFFLTLLGNKKECNFSLEWIAFSEQRGFNAFNDPWYYSTNGLKNIRRKYVKTESETTEWTMKRWIINQKNNALWKRADDTKERTYFLNETEMFLVINAVLDSNLALQWCHAKL